MSCAFPPELKFPDEWSRWDGKAGYIKIPGWYPSDCPPLRLTREEFRRMVNWGAESRVMPHPRFTLFVDRVFVPDWDYRDVFEVYLPYRRKLFRFGPNLNDERAFENLLAFLVKSKCVELIENPQDSTG